jgi:hypothetical protein
MAGQQHRSQMKNEQQDRDIRGAEESRRSQLFEWGKAMSGIMAARNSLDDIKAYSSMFADGLYQGGGALSPSYQAPNAPMAAPGGGALPTPQAMPGLGGVNSMPAPTQEDIQKFQQRPQILPAAAEGGAIEVPAQQGAMPAPMPQQPQQPAQNMPSRRDRYNQWYSEAVRLATLTGGLEGYQKFQQMEDAISRRETLGYALQAVRAMDEGNISEALRAGNTALEVTPFDTGLKFVAQNGKLYMQGADGSVGQPLTADALRAFTEDHLKTPENYLDWKQQYEVERSNRENEKDTDERNAINARLASVQEQYAAQKEEELPYDIGLKSAQMYKLLTDSLVSGDEGGMTTNQWATLKRNLQKDVLDSFTKGELGPAFQWMSDLVGDPGMQTDIVGTAMDMITPDNFLSTGGNVADAINFAAWLASGDLQDPEQRSMYSNRAPTGISDGPDDQGRYIIVYNGKPLYATRDIWARAMARRKDKTAVIPEDK